MKIKQMVLLGLGVAIVAFLFFPREGRPPSNTPEHRAAHGVVDGQVNEIWVGDTLLRIPPDVSFNPISSGRIERGRATQVTLGLGYPQYVKLETMSRVGIELQRGYEAPSRALPNDPDATIQEIPEWGLVEYRRSRDSGGWGYFHYWPLDESAVTPLGNRISFNCRGLPGKKPTTCRTAFVLHNDLQVWYYLRYALLPHWREIHSDVIQLVNSLIVQ